MKLVKGIRDKRIKAMQDLYKLALAGNDMSKEDIYKLLKEHMEKHRKDIKEQIYDTIYQRLEKNLVLSLQQLREQYQSFDEKRHLDIMDLFYSKDGKTLPERIDSWLDNEDLDLYVVFYQLCLILDTETFHILHKSMLNKVNIEYCEVIGCGECCEACENLGGELYPINEVESPPYHPNCTCQLIGYEKQDILPELDKE